MSKCFGRGGRAAIGVTLLLVSAVSSALTVTPTTDGSALGAALGGTGLTIDSVTVLNGANSQFGTYTGFNAGPRTIADGVVLSTGQVDQTTPENHSGNLGPSTTPSTDTGAPGTGEFNTYGLANIDNFVASFDVAKLAVTFTLSSASAVQFSFIFGSTEYPEYTSDYTDAFLVFLDGSMQITFDSNGKPVQVGSSFASSLETDDVNTAFYAPHGLIDVLTTISPVLTAGQHTLWFEVGDVNDGILDSAVFLANFGVCTPDVTGGGCQSGTNPTNPTPEPGTLALLGLGLAGLGLSRRRLAA